MCHQIIFDVLLHIDILILLSPAGHQPSISWSLLFIIIIIIIIERRHIDQIALQNSKQESSFRTEDFHGEVKPGQETVPM